MEQKHKNAYIVYIAKYLMWLGSVTSAIGGEKREMLA